MKKVKFGVFTRATARGCSGQFSFDNEFHNFDEAFKRAWQLEGWPARAVAYVAEVPEGFNFDLIRYDWQYQQEELEGDIRTVAIIDYTDDDLTNYKTKTWISPKYSSGYDLVGMNEKGVSFTAGDNGE